MSQLITFRSLQKLRFFLAGVFPFLARSPRLGDAPPKWLERYPRISKWWKPLRESMLRANAQRMANTFALGHFGDKQLDWSQIPRDSAPVLRAVIVLGALLCLLLPLAINVAWPPLAQEAITGVAGAPVAGWSVWLWMIAFAFAWSCALVGTSVASRTAFIPALVLFVYFGVVTVAALPKTWWNLLLPAQAAFALAYCESQRERGTRLERVRGIVGAAVSGTAVAFSMIVATPMTALFRAHLSLWVIAVGAALGVALWWVGGALQRHAARDAVTPFVRLHVAVSVLALAYLALLISLVMRGGLVAPAQGISSFAISVTGYLWPFYYFLGIGVVFKVLRQTKAVHSAAFELIPARYFVPFTLVMLTVATIVAWSEAVVARPAIAWLGWFAALCEGIYGATSWLWSRPVLGLTMPPMKWLLLLALAVAIWALVKRRFNSGIAAGLLFTVLLLWLGMFEYFFEFTGFSRSYQHTAFSLLLFSAFVLWLTHRTLFDFLNGSSTWWPQRARIAIYAAGLVFVLLPLHARAALHDGRLPNEIFLYLFFGVIDLGLPYYLYVYAQRRFKTLPLSVPAMLGVFCAGAVLSMPLTLLDKLAVAGWSVDAMWSHATAQAAGLLKGQPLAPNQILLSPAWIVARGLLAIGAIATLAALARRFARDVRHCSAAVVFSAIAVGAGLASFANRSVELPLVPLRIAQLITPLNSSVSIDASLIARHLSFLLAAMVIALTLGEKRRRSRVWYGLLVAAALHTVIALTWPAGEAWLRSTGALVFLGTGGIVLFLWLAAAVRDRLDGVLEPNVAESAEMVKRDSARLMLAPDVRWTCASLLVVLGMLTLYRSYTGRLVTHAITASSVSARLPVGWHPLASPPPRHIAGASSLALVAESNSGITPTLWAVMRSFEQGDTRAWLQGVAVETAQHLSNYNPVKLEQWDRYYPGGLALDFRYALSPDDSVATALGTTVLAPMPNGAAFVATVVYAPSDVARRWDLARALSALPRPTDTVTSPLPR